MHSLTKKAHDVLDLLEYTGDRVFHSSSTKGWTVGNTPKFIWFGLTKDEGVEKGFLEILPDNPLRELCKNNKIIPHTWIQKYLSENEYEKFINWMVWQWQSELGVWSWDVTRFLNEYSL